MKNIITLVIFGVLLAGCAAKPSRYVITAFDREKKLVALPLGNDLRDITIRLDDNESKSFTLVRGDVLLPLLMKDMLRPAATTQVSK